MADKKAHKPKAEDKATTTVAKKDEAESNLPVQDDGVLRDKEGNPVPPGANLHEIGLTRPFEVEENEASRRKGYEDNAATTTRFKPAESELADLEVNTEPVSNSTDFIQDETGAPVKDTDEAADVQKKADKKTDAKDKHEDKK